MSSPIDARDFAAASSALAHFDDQVDLVTDDTLEAIGETVLEHVRTARRRHRVTGKGERLVSLKSTGSGVARRIRVHAGGRVAHLLTGGTAPHRIRPLHRKALQLGLAGRPFAAVVAHPGTRADPFVARGVAAAMGEIDQLAAAGARELATQLSDEIGRR